MVDQRLRAEGRTEQCRIKVSYCSNFERRRRQRWRKRKKEKTRVLKRAKARKKEVEFYGRDGKINKCFKSNVLSNMRQNVTDCTYLLAHRFPGVVEKDRVDLILLSYGFHFYYIQSVR